MNNQEFLNQAELIGANCRIKNIKAAAQSKECLELIGKHGNTMATLAILNAFNKGWHNKHQELTSINL